MFRGREATEGTQPVKVNNKLWAALSGAVALLALSSLSACCGSDDTGKKLDAWAKGVCDQAAAQTKKINDANTAITKVDSAASPQDVKAADAAAFQADLRRVQGAGRHLQQGGRRARRRRRRVPAERGAVLHHPVRAVRGPEEAGRRAGHRPTRTSSPTA